ncbi:sensor histidine kinase [Oceanirhabdus seepicola]|uniref:histidine kinase n=1 Tax=Oceanirhabdus seepicola TaxID=2828781 RepID=A0A9J6P064_9CLOT|nr:HAMP domain-containing sensor histidine kinase [Oceanirhabdus seepicola]MCM1989748.1 two-component sensor histidine kinase [Oceanirhabdus seepicola]
MKSKSIVVKLFCITFSLFMVFLLIVMGFQRIFFDELYLKRKISTTEKNIEKFSQEYLKAQWSRTQIINNINIFTEKNNVPLLIVDEEGSPKYLNENESYTITIHTDDDLYVKVYLDSIIYNEGFQGFEPKLGDKIYLEGILMDEDNMYVEPYLVKINDRSYSLENGDETDEIINEEPEVNFSISAIKGEIVYINNSIDQEIFYDYRANNLLNEIYNYVDEFDEKKEIPFSEIIKTNSYVDPSTGIKSIIFKKSIMKSDGSKEMIFAMTSLQPIGEAIEVMMDYYIYLFLLAVIFIILISFIYSKIIADPLLEMNVVAKKMANLDFTVYSNVKANDEMGSLSESLNILSRNLNRSMTELKKANQELLDDIEKERIQEQIRKEFVASVSHELKTPLGIMKGFAEGIKDGIYEQKKDYYLDVIIDEIEKMDDMVREMLELSKLESKACALSKSEFDIKKMIVDIRNKFKHHEIDKNLSIHLNVEEKIVFADKRKIDQVIVNLYSNAIRYSNESGTINIRTEDNENEVYVYIENSGAYISEEEISKIWDRFYRVDKSRSRALGGTGLGLPIVKNILDIHGSEYGVRNTELGVEFYFSLLKKENKTL